MTKPWTPTEASLDIETYRQQRLLDQSRWYRQRALTHRRRHRVFATALALANLGAFVLGLIGWTPWALVVLNLAAALTAYATLTASDYQAVTYRATADRLDQLDALWSAGAYGSGDGAFRTFVHEVEQVLARERSAWCVVLGHVSGDNDLAAVTLQPKADR